MELRATPEEVELRRAGYVTELREFFSTAHVAFGSPDDLGPLNERLAASESFREDMVSLARSMIFREGGAFPSAELLLIFATAIAGEDTSRQPPEYPQQLRELLGFVTRVTRIPINQHRPLTPEKAPEAVAPARPFPGPSLVESRPPAPNPEPRPAATVVPIRATRPIADAVERANAEHQKPSPLPAAAPAPPVRRRTADRHRWWWIPAAGVAMALAAGFASRSYLHPASAASHVVILPVEGTAPAPDAKPSPGIPVAAASRHGAAPLSAGTARKPAPRIGALSTAAPPSAYQASVNEPSPEPPTASAPPSPALEDSTPASIGTPLVEEAPAARTPARGYVTTSRSGTRGLLDVSSGVMSANLISAPAPEYPKLAGLMHLEGPVILQAVISRSGSVAAVHVLRGHYMLRGAAVNAVRKWRYHPFVAAGHPVDVSTVVTVNFRRQH